MKSHAAVAVGLGQPLEVEEIEIAGLKEGEELVSRVVETGNRLTTSDLQ